MNQELTDKEKEEMEVEAWDYASSTAWIIEDDKNVHERDEIVSEKSFIRGYTSALLKSKGEIEAAKKSEREWAYQAFESNARADKAIEHQAEVLIKNQDKDKRIAELEETLSGKTFYDKLALYKSRLIEKIGVQEKIIEQWKMPVAKQTGHAMIEFFRDIINKIEV